MTPAIQILKQNKCKYTLHQYQHTPSNLSYGLEAAEKLGVAVERVFKTLVVSLDNNSLVVVVVPVSSMLSMKAVAKLVGVKKAQMATKDKVERATGYVLGGVSPLGQKQQLKTIIDTSAESHDTVFISAGRRGLEIELTPSEFITLTRASLADVCA